MVLLERHFHAKEETTFIVKLYVSSVRELTHKNTETSLVVTLAMIPNSQFIDVVMTRCMSVFLSQHCWQEPFNQKYIVISGINAIGFCAIYSTGSTPHLKLYLWYKSKNPWPWNKIAISHLVVRAQFLSLCLWPIEVPPLKPEVRCSKFRPLHWVLFIGPPRTISVPQRPCDIKLLYIIATVFLVSYPVVIELHFNLTWNWWLMKVLVQPNYSPP